jgi:hypothetical protein
MVLLILLVVVAAVALLAPRLGADSRPDIDESGCWI